MRPVLESLRSFVAQIGAGRLALMGAVATALLVAFAWMSLPGAAGPMGYLYTELEPAAAQTIADKLKAENIPFQLSADGTAIMAPVDRLADLRMTMASDRLGGKIGYEVLDAEEPFGVSSSRAKINETRAIEGELSRSIRSLQNVAQARVHIVMPDRSVFSTQPRRATAAVTVKTQGRLSGENIQAIRYLVSSSVPELSPESVSVIDHTGALLARAGEAGAGAAGDADERQQAVEAKLRQQIESLLEPIVGAGKVRAEVAAIIDRDQTREEASTVDPDKQAIARQVTVESNDQSNETDGGAPPATVAAQLPETQAADAAGGGESRRAARAETSEDVTYENSRTNTVRVRSPGKINRLTVAVMVDPGAQAMPAQQLQRLQRLVENAVGFDAERGDSVAVESMKFAAADVADEGLDIMSYVPTDQIFSVLKLLIIAGVGLFALRLLRPQWQTKLAEATAGGAMGVGENATLLAADGSPAALPGANDPDTLKLAMENAESRGALLDQEIALAEVDGKIKMSAIKRIGDAVAANPGEATSVVRQWMMN
jgi:flagellar M-ring protein FliF